MKEQALCRCLEDYSGCKKQPERQHNGLFKEQQRGQCPQNI